MNSQAQDIIIALSVKASPERVYAAFTTADGWNAWCSEKSEVDACFGGKFHIYTEGYNAYGEFTDLEQDRTVSFTWNGDKEPPTLIQIHIFGHNSQTGVTFKLTGLCSEQDWAGIADFLEHIWGHVLNHLKAVLEERQGE